MAKVATLTVNPENQWRMETPGSQGWARSPYPGAAKKYFMVSSDTHITPPKTLLAERIEAKYRDRLPRMERREDGTIIMHAEGMRAQRIVEGQLEGEDLYRAEAGSGGRMEDRSADIAKRLADHERDGIDAELVFPNGPAIGAFWTPDADFAQAQFRVYNDWAAEIQAPYRARMHIAAPIATGNIPSAVAEVHRVAKLGFDVLTLPTHPVPGYEEDPNQLRYNHRDFDALWAAIEETDLTITFHVATRGDPRMARGPGGAIINRARSHDNVVEPIVTLCASGILDRFPKLRFVAVEGGIGWVPALLDLMDETYRKHHMWVNPKLKHGLPSEYFRAHGGATYQEDLAGILLMEPYRLTENFCWANDYPHHEGTFPHSAQAIEREMGRLSEDARAKVLGLNAARLFKFEVPERFKA